MSTKPHIEIVQHRHVFTDPELLALTDKLIAARREQVRLEAELSSVKKDYQSRIERTEIEQEAAEQKLTDKFEIRALEATVEFDAPEKGMKTLRFTDAGAAQESKVAMTPADIKMCEQRVLPLDVPEPDQRDDEEDLNNLPEGKK
jgi:hypothetical protein